MRKEMLALLGFLRRQVGLRSDAASATGSTHAKLANIIAKIGTLPYDVMAYGSKASNTLRASADAEQGTGSSTTAKKKEIQVFVKGSIRTSFDGMRSGGISPHAQIYVNGIARGTTIGLPSTYTTYTEDINVQEGDCVQVYVDNGSDEGSRIKNFRLYWDYFVGVSNVTLD